MRSARFIRRRGLDAAIATLLALALAVMGVGHTAHGGQFAPAPTASVDLSAYVLPDGTAPVLCLGLGDPEGAGAATACDACRLLDDLASPEPCVRVQRIKAAFANDRWPSQPPIGRPGLHGPAQPRAPPAA